MRRVRKPAASTINATIRIRLGRLRFARLRRRFAIETPREPSYHHPPHPPPRAESSSVLKQVCDEILPHHDTK
jgi:hypothetical protein